jgi:signal transduction histidine kinase
MLLLALTMFSALAASPKHVLILFPFGQDVTPFNDVASAFCITLERNLNEPVDFYQIPLDLARYRDAEEEAPLVDFLKVRAEHDPEDLVVLMGGPTVQFAMKYRERIFPKTPVLVVAAEPQFIAPSILQTNFTSVVCKVNPTDLVEDVLQLQPQTTNIVMVFGASALENFWVNEFRREFQPFANRVGFTWLNNLSLDQIVKRCAALPPHSFIVLGLFVVDAAGIPCEQNEALRRLHETANAPLFGYFASDFGLGTIGGRLFPDIEIGEQGARAAIRILRGERAESISPQGLAASAPIYDWRELRRWDISEANLPPGSNVRFRQQGFWEFYRWRIVGVIVFCGLQAALIAVLLINRDKRRRGEEVARDLTRRLIRAHEEERARLGRELHDDVTQRLAILAIDAGRVERGADKVLTVEKLREIRAGLVRLSEDIHALSYRLHPSLLEDLGLTEALKAECERFSRQESISAEVTLRDVPDDIIPETALCLYRVAQEALRNVARHARASRVDISVRPLNSGLQLVVHDDGIGFDPARQRTRRSLGLASMRERVILVNGELDVESAPGQGTTILVTVPLNKDKAEG